ncbi:MAG: bifunctional folylpolyglutamate synthase/dihydrofolate synthase [Proteobacteria bacterium]|nr:bifunctional folylpolyglutamate synthase/dihydrofolate synthase [Pseudomonadota bacterium]
MMRYSDTMSYLYGLEKFGMVFGLENIKWLLSLINNPHSRLKTVHIGGTNGKGSVASMLSHILKEAGYTVGKYTSPHLISFNERITVNEKEITDKEVSELTETIRKKAEKENKGKFFTFFDFTTALAFEHFSRKKTDISMIEVGLGGRFDSTNVIDPLISIITNVSYDHTEQLGEDIADIAKEKAGIIKDSTPVVTGAQGTSVQLIEATAKSFNSPVYKLHRDFSYNKTGDQIMSYRGINKSIDNLSINLMGDHQFVNGAISLCAAEVLSSFGFDIKEDSLRKALSCMKWQGRLEVVKKNPTIILDGAHNPDSANVLAEFFKSHYTDKKKMLIFGVMKDKDYRKIIEKIVPFTDTVILTRPATERALPPSEIEGYIKNPFVTEDVRSALIKAKSIADRNSLILVTGSFYTIGEAKAIIDEIF